MGTVWEYLRSVSKINEDNLCPTHHDSEQCHCAQVVQPAGGADSLLKNNKILNQTVLSQNYFALFVLLLMLMKLKVEITSSGLK